MQKNKGFTLAEVLITLGIIGVVAALTIPVFISNYKKKQTVTQLKASYSIIAQAIKMSEAENGDKGLWDFDMRPKEFYNAYLKKYMKFQNSKAVRESNIKYRWLNGSEISGQYKEVVDATYIGYLLNGSSIYIHSGPIYSVSIMVDINGDKRPNKVGIDLFHFILDKKKGLIPYGLNTEGDHNEAGFFGFSLDRKKLTSPNIQWACSAKKYGRWCTALIMNDGWEIAPDYPWTTR